MMLLQGNSCSWFRPVCIQRVASRCRHRPRRHLSNALKQDLLYWATDTNPLYEQLPVAIEDGEYGRCLVAQRDIQADEVVLSVCMDRVFSSQAADQLEIHWAAEMAVRLLQARHACRQAAGNGHFTTHSSTSRADGDDVSISSSNSFWKTWIDSLPERSVTPVEFTDEEVQQLVFSNAVEAVLNMRTCLEDCYEYLQPQLEEIDCGWKDFLWAVQVLHSRCFFDSSDGGRHLAVPGIDMCNHSSTAANAAVRVIHSPGACQGLSALEEVAAAAAAGEGAGSITKSYFQLVAGSEGISTGEQVCISYGSWPAEPFLMLFGFIPQPNPNDCVILFNDLQHMAVCYLACLVDNLEGVQQRSDLQKCCLEMLKHESFKQQFLQQVADREEQQQQQGEGVDSQLGPSPGYRFMFVKASEMDGRLHSAMQVQHEAAAAAAAAAAVSESSVLATVSNAEATANTLQQLQQQVKVGDLVAFRLKQLLQQLEQVIPQLKEQQQQQQQRYNLALRQPAVNSEVDSHIYGEDQRYQASVDHTNLVLAYCSSKAVLARQLIATYSDPISMIIAAGASRR